MFKELFLLPILCSQRSRMLWGDGSHHESQICYLLVKLAEKGKEAQEDDGPINKYGQPWSCHFLAHYFSGACPIPTAQTPNPQIPCMALKQGETQ